MIIWGQPQVSSLYISTYRGETLSELREKYVIRDSYPLKKHRASNSSTRSRCVSTANVYISDPLRLIYRPSSVMFILLLHPHRTPTVYLTTAPRCASESIHVRYCYFMYEYERIERCNSRKRERRTISLSAYHRCLLVVCQSFRD